MPIPKVLLVNDDPASLFALESLLMGAARRQEYELLTAASGQDALRHVLRHDFAVILLDVSMPGMDGFETAAAIHSHPRSLAVPIIFITAHYADEINRLKAYQSGAADYLFTPVVPQVLQAKVAVFVELTKKNLQLQLKSEQLARLNQDLRVQRLRDLERINAALEQEVAERKQAEQRACELSIRDALTGLVNRRSLIQQLEHALARADRGHSEFALLFLDLDQFKSVNDSLGHEVGDELLRQVAARLTAAVRVSDVVARLGGDEFVVLVEGKAAAINAARVARKIGLAHARPYEIGNARVKTSSSIGIALYPQDGDSAHLLLRHADLAMYHAKQERRGSIQFFHDELNYHEQSRDLWRQEVRAALAGDQFELRYQPKVALTMAGGAALAGHSMIGDATLVEPAMAGDVALAGGGMAGVEAPAGGATAGVEALLYWRHPRLGTIAAPAWQAHVPDRALLDQIDDWCLRAACEQATRLREAAHPDPAPAIAINLLGTQLRPDLAHTLLALLRRHKLGPASIELELPEQLLCGPLEAVQAVLRPLRVAGVRIGIDDFGSAGASLTACQRLPLDTLKISAAFVRAIGTQAGGADMAAAIILLARALGLTTVALGVQTPAQLVQLAALGCDQYQGDLTGAPFGAADLLRALRQPAVA